MMTKKQFGLALRDGMNKLLGKQALIEEYMAALRIINNALAEMSNDDEREQRLSKALDELQETVHYKDKYGDFQEDVGFNPYESRKRILKTKLADIQKLISQYGLSK